MVINRLLPPYERNGRVTPVTGIKPTTTIRFNIAWKARPNVIPNDRYFPNKSSVFIAILKPDTIIVMNNVATIKTPIKPNS